MTEHGAGEPFTSCLLFRTGNGMRNQLDDYSSVGVWYNFVTCHEYQNSLEDLRLV